MLCEIHFVPHAEREWDPKRPLALYNSVSNDFPDMELVPEVDTQDFPGDSPRVAMQNPTSRIRFANHTKSRFLQIASAGDVFVANFIDHYPGWAAVKQEITECWGALSHVLMPSDVWRVALRYINRVQNTEKAPYVSDWLKPTKSIPGSMMEAMPGSYNISNIKLDEGHKSRVTVRFSETGKNKPFGSTIVDINRVWDSQGKSGSSNLVGILDTLHDDVWNEFSSALTDKYISYLNEEK